MNDQDSRDEALKELMGSPRLCGRAGEACRWLFVAEEEKDAEALWEGLRGGGAARANGERREALGGALRGSWASRMGFGGIDWGFPEIGR